MDTYPRYDVFTSTAPEGDARIAHRVSKKRAEYLLAPGAGLTLARKVAPPRFRIKVATWPTKNPIVLTDRNRRGFRGQYRTLDAACRAMDNTVRRERGMPERIDVSVAEIRQAMTA